MELILIPLSAHFGLAELLQIQSKMRNASIALTKVESLIFKSWYYSLRNILLNQQHCTISVIIK